MMAFLRALLMLHNSSVRGSFSPVGGLMSADYGGWTDFRPGESLLDRGGQIYGWRPDLEQWESSGEYDHDAGRILQGVPVGAAVAWSIDGHPLYRKYIPIPPPPEIPRVDGLARTARVFSWLGFLSLPFGIVGLILGYTALSRISENDARSRSVAWTAIVVGWIFTVLTAVLVVLILTH